MRLMKVTHNNGQLIFEPIPIGGKRNVAYFVGDRDVGELAVVDAGFQHESILGRVRALSTRVKYVLATHCHRDHFRAAPALRRATGAKLAAYKSIPGVDVPLDDGHVLWVGAAQIEVLHTPGHTADSICFLVNGRKLLTGDTLYVGRVSKAATAALQRPFYESLHNRLMKLPDEVEVWPGHDVGDRPSSTVGEERRGNTVLRMDFAGFCNRRWDKNKKRWVV